MEEAGAISVATLRGVGEQRAQALARLGIVTVEDLLLHYPRGYIDLTPEEIRDIVEAEQASPARRQ